MNYLLGVVLWFSSDPRRDSSAFLFLYVVSNFMFLPLKSCQIKHICFWEKNLHFPHPGLKFNEHYATGLIDFIIFPTWWLNIFLHLPLLSTKLLSKKSSIIKTNRIKKSSKMIYWWRWSSEVHFFSLYIWMSSKREDLAFRCDIIAIKFCII